MIMIKENVRWQSSFGKDDIFHLELTSNIPSSSSTSFWFKHAKSLKSFLNYE